MAAQVTVLDLTRRHIIKVTPAMYMSEVRDEVCRKSAKRHTNFDLKSNGKSIDLSKTWRQSGLSPGAKLELVEASRTPSAVSVALQLPSEIPGGRLTDKVRSDDTLWQILRRFETNAQINITQRGVASLEGGSSGAGRIVYEMPRLNLTGRMASSIQDLQKTLAQFGFNSGSVLLKLDFVKTDQPLEEAMVEISKDLAISESETKSQPAASHEDEMDAVASTTERVETSKDESQIPPESSSLPLSSSSAAALPGEVSAVVAPAQQLQVFAPPTSTVPHAATLPHNEQDYEPTISQIEKHNTHLAAQTHNQRLLSDAEEATAQATRAARVASITEVKVKIRFPDQSVVVDTLAASDSGADLYRRVRAMMHLPMSNFRLVYADRGPRTVPDDDGKRLIRDLGFVGNVLVNLHWAEDVDALIRNEPVLKQELRAMAVENPAARQPGLGDEDKEVEAGGESAIAKKEDDKSTKDKVKGAMPKWFKGIGKK